jgi:hypothetical protein
VKDAARSSGSRRARQSEEHEYRPVEPNNVGGVKRADPLTREAFFLPLLREFVARRAPFTQVDRLG